MVALPRMERTVTQRLIGGVVGGEAGGLVFGILMAMMGMLPMVAGLVGSSSAAVGFIVHLVFSAIIGAGFGLAFGARCATYREGALWGLLYGAIWWVLGPLVLMPRTRTVAPATNTLHYLHADHLGSVSVATDGAGNVVSRQEFTPWGEVRAGGIAETTLNYTGQRKDGTGLLYYHARYYDPATGRFISADSIVPGTKHTALTVGFHQPDCVERSA